MKNNQANQAIELFKRIEKPDEIVLNIFFNACAHVGTADVLSLVKKVWKEIPISVYSNHRVLTSLLDALINCGDCSSAELLFFKNEKICRKLWKSNEWI